MLCQIRVEENPINFSPNFVLIKLEGCLRSARRMSRFGTPRHVILLDR